MNLSKLLHQILHHADKILTEQHFLAENVSPEPCPQLFKPSVFWRWVGAGGPHAPRRGGCRRCRVANGSGQLGEHRPSAPILHAAAHPAAGTHHAGRSAPGGSAPAWPSSGGKGGFRSCKHRVSNTPVSGENIHKMWDL